ncbi:NR5A2 protein, partial [Polypterus senegalus]|nr:NR5A2 protein [Polypterus senegalus]
MNACHVRPSVEDDFNGSLVGPDPSPPGLYLDPACEQDAAEGELCPVCGDRVSGYHYGLLTCESCKGFFKRTVQNNKHYICVEEQSCPIDKTQRKRCPSCRFQKCLSVGMKPEAIRADRMRGGRNKFSSLYRRDRQMKQQKKGLDKALQAVKLEEQGVPYNIQPDPSALAAISYLPRVTSHQCMFPATEEPIQCANTTSPSDVPFFTPPLYDTQSGHQKSASSSLVSILSPASIPASINNSSPVYPGPASSLILEMLKCEVEDYKLRSKVLSHLQKDQTTCGKHDCHSTFRTICRVAEKTLFALVEWARGCCFFKEIKVEDQMKLLQNCWSELLVIDHLYRQVTYGREGHIMLVTGQQIEVVTLTSEASTVLASLVARAQGLVVKLRALQMDKQEFVCLKYLVLFNPDAKGLESCREVSRIQEQVNRALMDYTMQGHQLPTEKFGQLLLKLSEIRIISLQAEDYLYLRHLQGDVPCNSLLMEMLHAKQA